MNIKFFEVHFCYRDTPFHEWNCNMVVEVRGRCVVQASIEDGCTLLRGVYVVRATPLSQLLKYTPVLETVGRGSLKVGTARLVESMGVSPTYISTRYGISANVISDAIACAWQKVLTSARTKVRKDNRPNLSHTNTLIKL